MADAVLDFLTQLGKTLVVAFRNEDRVVAETFGAVLFGSDMTVYDAVKLMDFLMLVQPQGQTSFFSM